MKLMCLKACGFSLSLFIFANASAAERFIIDGGFGFAKQSTQGFKRAGAIDASFAYAKNDVFFRAGTLLLNEFKTNDARADENSSIDIRGVHLGITKEIEFEPIYVELGGGLLVSRVEGEFKGREVIDDSDQNAFLNAKLIVDFNRLLALQADYKYIQDAYGTDINTLTAGLRYSF